MYAQRIDNRDLPFETSGHIYHHRQEGGSQTEFPIDAAADRIVECIKQGIRLVELDALPNSGKSKRLPALLATRGYRVLVLVPQVADLPDMVARLSEHGAYCYVKAGRKVTMKTDTWVSGNKHVSMASGRKWTFNDDYVQILSVGLAARWVHDKRSDYDNWWNDFSVVLCDEANFVQTDFLYGNLISELRLKMHNSTFVLMSGTLPSNLIQNLQATRIVCHERKYALDSYRVVLSKAALIVSEACKFVRRFFKDLNKPVLLFVAGKAEMTEFLDQLRKVGIEKTDIQTIHGDMGPDEVHKRTQASQESAPKVYI